MYALENEKKTIEWFTEKQNLCEGVSSGVSVSLLGLNNKQACVFMHCRDWTQDSVFAAVNQKAVGIYGFSYDPAKHPALNFDKMTMLAAHSGANDLKDRMPNVIRFMRGIEKELKLIPTKVYECLNPPIQYSKSGVYLFEGSKRWMTAPALVSAYSLLIRSGFHCPMDCDSFDWLEKVANGATTYVYADNSLWKNAKNAFAWFKKYGIYRLLGQDLKENFPWVSAGTMHNGMGIQSFSIYVADPNSSYGDGKSYYSKIHKRLKDAEAGKKLKKKKPEPAVEPEVLQVKEVVVNG